MKFPKYYNFIKQNEWISLWAWGEQWYRLSIDIRASWKTQWKTFTINEKYKNPKWYNIRGLSITFIWIYKKEVYCCPILFWDCLPYRYKDIYYKISGSMFTTNE